MFRFLPLAIPGLFLAGSAAAQCRHWAPYYPPPVIVPVYPVNPAAFWGTPAPLPLPPAPKRFIPKDGVGIREVDESPTAKPKGTAAPKVTEPAEKEPPRIPKVKLPDLPDVPDEPKPPASKDAVNKNVPTALGKAVEQFIIPAEGNRAERPAEVRVGFFNHSEREIVLEVNGEIVKLPSEQYVTLRLKRTFTWAEKGQKATDVAVPPDADGMEIVFRK